LQHTPSVQKPDAHSAPFVQAAPLNFWPQLPATHFVPAQSASDEQVEKQALVVVSQPKGAHSVSGPALHRPLPSQTLPPLTAVPSQVPARQTVPAAYLRHAPAPSHVPSRPQVPTSPLGHSLAARGTAPSEMNEQVPGAPTPLQVLHVSVQLVLQQTPSAQKPLAHSAPQAQAWPFGFVPRPSPQAVWVPPAPPPDPAAPPPGGRAAGAEPQPAATTTVKQKARRSLRSCRRVRPASIVFPPEFPEHYLAPPRDQREKRPPTQAAVQKIRPTAPLGFGGPDRAT
jgi:hypothetical protein